MPEQPAFDIDARIPDERDYRDGEAEAWSDLILEVTNADAGERTRLDITRGAGEAIIEVLGDVLHRWAGKSIKEHIWSELVMTIDGLMSGEPDEEERGYARGLATALAYLYNPIAPDVDAVRAEAMERWEATQAAEVPFG